MKRLYPLVFFFVTVSLAFGQFVSPGNGQTYTLKTISETVPAVLVNNGSYYTLASNITIASGDKLVINEDTTLKMNAGTAITVGGSYETTATNFTVTASDAASPYKGFTFEAGSKAVMKNTLFEYGNLIRVGTGDFLMDNCTVRYFKTATGITSAMSFSEGSPTVQNSKFIENDNPAFGSGANQTVSATISNNYLYGNTKLNSNRPQINLGPSGAGVLKITNNTIVGNRANTMVGGISASSLLGIEHHFLIEGNTIRDNRYGVTVAGTISQGKISGNIIENNNTETNPLNGGSGIALSGNATNSLRIIIENNQIHGNLWGITLAGNSQADIGGGTLGSSGNNIFANNKNGNTVYALYNNTPNNISALNNCWREGEASSEAMVEEVIVHKVDSQALGKVSFAPYLCALPLALYETEANKFLVYPIPNNGNFTIETNDITSLLILDSSGKIIYQDNLKKGINNISLNVSPGIYYLISKGRDRESRQKIIVK